MKTKGFLTVVLGLWALASPASAQIIATSIPRADTVGAAAEKRWAFHVMGSPFAKWNYGELYLDPSDVFGTIQGTPNSDFLFAGEILFAAGTNFSIGVGGWYNKIGANEFDFDGFDVTGVAGFADIGAVLDTDIKTYEGHLGIFYKDVGIQGGIVKSTGKLGPTARITRFEGVPISGDRFPFSVPDAETTDWDVFGVYKHGFGGRDGQGRAGLAIGAGIYRKQGIAGTSPLRLPTDETVFSGFATLNVNLYRGIGIDVSYWYVGPTGETFGGEEFPDDSQSRFTIGIGISV
ncbi:MAG TPA: hypothetical protein VLI67_06175, partial [Vicinamibacteria bacterium]|nr:hypothetical protein [Vicinamibacteria bacterium]